MVAPITKEAITADMLDDFIMRAMNMVEIDAQIDIAPVQRRYRLPFARDLYSEYMYLELHNKPILSVDKLSITTSNADDIYTFPPEWIDPANFIEGRINVVPLSPAVGGTSNFRQASQVGGGFLVMIGLSEDLPAYWEVEATSGFRLEQGVPVWINELVGLKAAIMLFDMLIPQFQYSSHSISIDGTSQSQTTQAPQLYEQVKQSYIQKYDDLVGKIRIKYNNSIMVGMI